MPKTQSQYRSHNVATFVTNQVWLCDARKVSEIVEFLEFRAGGQELSEEVIRGAFSATIDDSLFLDDSGRRVDVDGVRLLTIDGVIAPKMNLMSQMSGGTSLNVLNKELVAAARDESVKTIMLLVDSPGGVAQGVAESAKLIREIGQEKRVVGFAENMLSAALWLGSAASEVFASETSDIGSQGALVIHKEMVKANEEKGITYTVARAGENKALRNSVEPLSDRGFAEMQRDANKINAMFVSAMAENRGVSEEFVLDRFGQGSVFMGAEALERNLIDGVRTFGELVDQERARSVSRTTVSVVRGVTDMNAQVKAALFAKGFITSLEASDDECRGIVRGLAHSAGIKGDISEEKQLQLVMGEVEPPEVVEPDRTVVRDPGDADERFRARSIRLAGDGLGVAAEDVLEAIDKGLTLEEAREKFLALAEANQGPVDIVSGDASQDKLAVGTMSVLLDRMGGELSSLTNAEERSYGREMSSMSLMEIARTNMQALGYRPTGNPDIDAKFWLSMGSPQVAGEVGDGQFVGGAQLVTGPDGMIQKVFVAQSGEGSANRRGDHPDALSSLMGRVMEAPPDEAATVFQDIYLQLPDLPDFRARSFIETGVFQELEYLEEDAEAMQLMFDTNLKAVIQAHDYAGKAGLTTKMVVDDDLGTFPQQLQSLQPAGRNTLDNLCRSLLNSNPTMADGTAMFHADHNNLITSGAAPSDDAINTHDETHRLIKGYGSSRTMNRGPTIAYGSQKHARAFRRTLLNTENKVPVSDATINTFRGLISPVIDSELNAHDADAWYTFVSRAMAPLGYAFRRGTGGINGTRTTWVNPATGTRWTQLLMSFGVAPINWRGAVKNPGV